MSNHITIEFCEADRARIDNLAIKFGELIDRLPPRIAVEVADPIQKQLSAIVANAKEQKTEEPAEVATEAAQDATEGANPTEDTPPEAEKPTAAKNEPAPMTEEEAAKERAKLRSKFIELSAANKKEEAKAIVLEYAGSIPAVPADKLVECYNRLCALEG